MQYQKLAISPSLQTKKGQTYICTSSTMLWVKQKANPPPPLIIWLGSSCYFTITVPLVPEKNPVYEGGLAEFACNGLAGSTNRQWLINGTQFESLNVAGVTILDRNRTLEFTNIPLEYNGTTVQCTLDLTGVQQSSTVGTLLVQGNDSQLPSMYLSSSHYRVVGCCF